jgi:hypothetical protein
MPGTFVVDTRSTFAAALLMASGPKIKFQSTEQDVSTNGERKWEVQAALTWNAEPGMRPVAEVISITMFGGADPAANIPPGSPVEFDGFRVGISAPERTERGVRGGKPWYQASGVRALNGSRPKADA